MLEKIPEPLGRALSPLRAGADHLVWADEGLQAPETIVLGSEAFEPDGPLPADCTEDGAGRSPPLSWRELPAGAREAVLIVEDADSPTPRPIVHCLAWGLPVGEVRVPAGAFSRQDATRDFGVVGKNSFRKMGWLPPDPPTGHGPHCYVFQLFALDAPLDLAAGAEKHDLVKAMRGHVLARGRLSAHYERTGTGHRG